MNKFLTRYTHFRPNVGDLGPSATSQQYKGECDVEEMMRLFRCGKPLPVKASGIYGDFTDITDYQTCLEKVIKAEEDFASLPSSIRERFGHDPHKFVEFALDPANMQECIKLGIRETAQPSAVDRIVDAVKDLQDVVTRKGEVGAVPASVQVENT